MVIELSKILAFPNFYNQIRKEKVPFKTAHQLFQLNQEIEPHISFYYEKANEIILEFGEKNSKNELITTQDGSGIKIKQEETENCRNKFKELENIKVQVSDYSFSLEDFSCLQLSLNELEGIIPFIKKLSD